MHPSSWVRKRGPLPPAPRFPKGRRGLKHRRCPVASQSRVTMLVKAKDVGKPICMPIRTFNQQSGGPLSKTSPQKLTIVHMKVLRQPPQTSKEEPIVKPSKPQMMTSKACQTTRIYRSRGRKKVEEVEQEPCTALVKTFPQPQKKGRRKRKNAITTQCVVFCCEACGDAFSAAKHLHRHWQTTHRKKPLGKHKCSFCNYTSDRKAHVKMHERTHTGERPFSCYICQKGFYRADDVETHMRVHTKEKPVRKHEKMLHAGEYPHYCPHCGKGLANNYKLKLHLRARHFQFKMEDSDEEGENVTQTVKTE
ncbi:hypothetical protein MRX96_038849 [Rhipicephalus microplus]